MLFGDRTKYVTLVLSLAFAAMLMNQQGAIFLGLLKQATGPLQNVTQPDLWVTDPDTPWVAEFRALEDRKLNRVRSVSGVAWAEPFFSGYAVCELSSGTFKKVQILGLPRGTLVGRPPRVTEGRIEDLWIPDAIMVEERSRKMLGNPKVGDAIKINDRRAVVVGFCRAKLGFESNAIVYSTFDNAAAFSPVGRERISYVLVKVKQNANLADVKQRINNLGDVVAYEPDEFGLITKRFIMVATGIGVNFGITIALGFLVGLLMSASVFYQFTTENIRHFATLKAMGAGSTVLSMMVMLQAVVVGLIGFGMGVGAAGIFTLIARITESELSAVMPWQLAAGSFVATLLTILMGSVLSIRRVLKVPPGVVFSG